MHLHIVGREVWERGSGGERGEVVSTNVLSTAWRRKELCWIGMQRERVMEEDINMFRKEKKNFFLV